MFCLIYSVLNFFCVSCSRCLSSEARCPFLDAKTFPTSKPQSTENMHKQQIQTGPSKNKWPRTKDANKRQSKQRTPDNLVPSTALKWLLPSCQFSIKFSSPYTLLCRALVFLVSCGHWNGKVFLFSHCFFL